MNLIKIDEDGNILAIKAYQCAPHRVRKIFKDSEGNILICGDYFSGYTSHSFFAKTDSNFQSFTFQYYKGAVDQVHDALINSSDEIIMSGLNWEDAIGEYWNAALLKINSNGDVIWGSHFVSQDWLVSEFFGVEKGTDPNAYFVIFEPEYFHGITNPFQTLGILRFTEDGIADKIFYRNDSVYFYTMLERGKDSSYIEALTNPNSSNGIIWKSDGLISSLHTNGVECFTTLEYDYPLSEVTVNKYSVSHTSVSPLSFSTGSITQLYNWHSQQLTCSFNWIDSTTAVHDPDALHELRAWPNPCSTVFHLSSWKTIKQLSVSDITGRIVLSQTIHDQREDIHVNELSPGIYFACLMFYDGEISVFKIQVER
jgi:hypothetical protein